MLANDDFDSISAVPTLNAFSVYPHGMEAQGLLYTQKLEGILKHFNDMFFLRRRLCQHQTIIKTKAFLAPSWPAPNTQAQHQDAAKAHEG